LLQLINLFFIVYKSDEISLFVFDLFNEYIFLFLLIRSFGFPFLHNFLRCSLLYFPFVVRYCYCVWQFIGIILLLLQFNEFNGVYIDWKSSMYCLLLFEWLKWEIMNCIGLTIVLVDIIKFVSLNEYNRRVFA
jgi:hypothetical protein